jgi:hypothetical protein
MLFRVPVLAVATFALVSPAAAQSWGWGCGCGSPLTHPITAVVDPIPYVTPAPAPLVAAPVVAAGVYVVAPNVRRPIYVVNQGPVYSGPDITVVPSLRVEGPYQPYPYIRTYGGYGGYDGYGVKRSYARRYSVYRYRGAPVRYHSPGHITRVAPPPPK